MIEKRILVKLQNLDDYLEKISELLPETLEDYRANFMLKMAIERILQICIELMVDISLMLVKMLKLGVPRTEENSFELLEDYLEHSQRYKEMKRFRNFLVHRYEDINDSIVFLNASENLTDFYDFISEVKKILSSGEKTS